MSCTASWEFAQGLMMMQGQDTASGHMRQIHTFKGPASLNPAAAAAESLDALAALLRAKAC